LFGWKTISAASDNPIRAVISAAGHHPAPASLLYTIFEWEAENRLDMAMLPMCVDRGVGVGLGIVR
jgi:hypothetical protein